MEILREIRFLLKCYKNHIDIAVLPPQWGVKVILFKGLIEYHKLDSDDFYNADDLILEAESLKKNYTSIEIKEGIKSDSSKTSFFKMANEHIENLNSLGKHNRASSEQGMLNNISLMLKKGYPFSSN